MAIIAESSKVADEFIDIGGEPQEEFLALDLETTNDKFIEAPDALALCIRKSEEEKPTLKDEDFEERLVELGIDYFGRGVQAKVDELQQVGCIL